MSFSASAALGRAATNVGRGFGSYLATQGVCAVAGIPLGLLAWPVLLAVRTDPPLMNAVGAALSLAGLLFAFLGACLGIVVADAVERGERQTWRKAWRRAAPRMGAFLGFSLLSTLSAVGVLLAALALSIPLGTGPLMVLAALPFAIWLFVVWSVAGPLVVLERQGPIESMRRSALLTAGSRGSIFLAFAFVALLLLVPAVALFGVFGPPSVEPGGTPGSRIAADLLWLVVQTAGGFLLSALVVQLHSRLAKERREGGPQGPAPVGA